MSIRLQNIYVIPFRGVLRLNFSASTFFFQYSWFLELIVKFVIDLKFVLFISQQL